MPIDTMTSRIVPQKLIPHYARLRRVLESHGSMLIAYSGGVDSGLLAYVGYRVLGERARPVIGISDSLAGREEEAAVDFLEKHRIPYERIETAEMTNEGYRRNHPDRCYFCKAELFSKLESLARERGFDRIAYGANVDDAADHRPGAVAAEERRVIAPLVEAGLGKTTIRALAEALGLELWDKPAAPCLASRVPYYHKVTAEKLAQIEDAENLLKDLGFPVCRVRHYGEVGRIEVPLDVHARLLSPERWSAVIAGFKDAGFRYVTLDSEGFRSGRLNDILAARETH